MTLKLLEGLRRFQEHLLELGVARGVLSLPAPRMLSLPSPSGMGAEVGNLFARLIVETEIVEVARDLFASGHYSLSVQEAFKAVDKYVARKAKRLNMSGTKLMELVFSANDPVLFWSGRRSQSEVDEQLGYLRLFSGAMLGIRNPVTHEFNWVDDGEVALELIGFAQHLLRKAKASKATDDTALVE